MKNTSLQEDVENVTEKGVEKIGTMKQDNKFKEKYKRRLRLKENRLHKPKSKRNKSGKGVTPIFERCIKCGKNTTDHHIFCNRCWKKEKNSKCFTTK